MPGDIIPTTAKGWPYLDLDNYLEVTPRYTSQLAAKLETADADVAAAINAATAAQAAAATIVDTGWVTIHLNAGYTGTARYRIRAGVCYLDGRVTRTAGNFPTVFESIAALPSPAHPNVPMIYTGAIANNGDPRTVAISTQLQVRGNSGGTSPIVELASIPCYLVVV